MEDKEIHKKIQVKFNQHVSRLSNSFTRPRQKFVKDITFGILKSGDVKLTSIARSLEEKATVKKASERLGRHLQTPQFHKELNNRLSSIYKREFTNESYLILDLSDLAKPKAKRMQGLALVRDGSKSTKDEPSLVNGYYLCNVLGRKSSSNTLYPLYSELYSLKEEITSENDRILEAIRTVSSNIKKGIWVLDRGGDRNTIIKPLLKAHHSFIIRQQGNRKLKYKGNSYHFMEIAKKVKLKYTVKSKTQGKIFKAGALRVSYKNFKQSLWLVVARFVDGGYFYFLCHLPEIFNPEIAVKIALEGYQMRWSIEEVHRHMKEDFNLEDVRLLTYQSLKNIMPLLWFALSFLYVKLKPISLKIIAQAKIKVLLKNKLSELKGFIYYKLYKALKSFLESISTYKIKYFKDFYRDKEQLILKL